LSHRLKLAFYPDTRHIVRGPLRLCRLTPDTSGGTFSATVRDNEPDACRTRRARAK